MLGWLTPWLDYTHVGLGSARVSLAQVMAGLGSVLARFGSQICSGRCAGDAAGAWGFVMCGLQEDGLWAVACSYS